MRAGKWRCALKSHPPGIVEAVTLLIPSASLLMEAIGCLARGLLVIVGAEAIFCTDITRLSNCGQTIGRVSVDVHVDPKVSAKLESLDCGWAFIPIHAD